MKKISIFVGFLTLIASSVFAMDQVKEVNIFSARHYDSDVQLYENLQLKLELK